jgi:hypothetical protein
MELSGFNTGLKAGVNENRAGTVAATQVIRACRLIPIKVAEMEALAELDLVRSNPTAWNRLQPDISLVV